MSSANISKVYSQTVLNFESLTQKIELTKREKQDFWNTPKRELLLTKIQDFIDDKSIKEYSIEQKYKYARIYLVRVLVYEYYSEDKSQLEIENVQNYKWLFEKNIVFNSSKKVSKPSKLLSNNILKDSLNLSKKEACKIKKIDNYSNTMATISMFLADNKFLNSEKRREISKEFLLEIRENPHLYNSLLWASDGSKSIISDYYVIKNMVVNPSKNPIH